MTLTKTLVPYVAAIVFLGLWAGLVYTGQAPADDFITALTGALSGLGVHGIHQGIAKAASND